MDAFKKERSFLRGAITKEGKKEDNFLKEAQLMDKINRLFKLDDEIKKLMFDSVDTTDEILEEEFTTVESYREKCMLILDRVREVKGKDIKPIGNQMDEEKKKYNLPLIQWVTFDGEVKNWIKFWGQFQKIDSDKKIEAEDKYHYLVQATTGRARKIVESYPPSAGNYAKVIEVLKRRFAREDVLIYHYVRELLNIMILRLTGVTTDKYACILLPMIESALPVHVLKEWEKVKIKDTTFGEFNLGNNACVEVVSGTKPLEGLLEFLRLEVESEEKVVAASKGFSFSDLKGKWKEQMDGPKQATASSLFNARSNRDSRLINKGLCIFCEKEGHFSQNCAEVLKLKLDDRRKIVREKRVCFNCLMFGHFSRECKRVVRCRLCGKSHYAILCAAGNSECKDKAEGERRNQVQSAAKEGKAFGKDTQYVAASNEFRDHTVISLMHRNQDVLLQTLQVYLYYERHRLKVRCLLDSGSQHSYILDSTAQKIGLQASRKLSMIHNLFGGVTTQKHTHLKYDINVGNLEGTFDDCFQVLGHKRICNRVSRVQVDKDLPSLLTERITLSDVGEGAPEIEILLGADCIGKLLTGNCVKVNDKLTAVETLLGWTVMGILENNVLMNMGESATTMCFQNIAALWELELLGIRGPDSPPTGTSKEDIYEDFLVQVRMDNSGHYEVNLPWSWDIVDLPSNLELAKLRLQSTTKRLCNGGKLRDYDKVFRDWERQGIIEEVKVIDETGHYLCHHPVFKESSLTTKIRPVFDASAQTKLGYSLNNCLKKGSNMIALIPDILLQFRRGKIGVVSDIKQAFLMISVAESDRNYLKFLWWKNLENAEFMGYRHCRVVFGLTPSPFLLAATLRYHLENSDIATADSEIVKKLKECFYVDNCVTSVNNEGELLSFISGAQRIMRTGQFELRSWAHSKTAENCPEGLADCCAESKGCVVPVLGLRWDTEDDVLSCDVSKMEDVGSAVVTKRQLLATAQMIFDPIGLASPVSVLPKLLLQKAWIMKLDWDTELPEDIRKPYGKWLSEVKYLKECKIARFLFQEETRLEGCTLHVFCDGSKAAYGACVFMRSEVGKRVEVKLVIAKSRVSPVKELSIPKIELMAAVIAVRLYKSIVLGVQEFQRMAVTFWTDSQVVLCWLDNQGRRTQFVRNRVKEILNNSRYSNWRHIPGNLNPADLLSRGCSGKALWENQWWSGPRWLYGNFCEWPQSKVSHMEQNILISSQNLGASSGVGVDNVEDKMFSANFVRFSRFMKNVRVMAWVRRFIRNTRKTASMEEETAWLSSEELEAAERELWKIVQREVFKEEEMKSIKTIQPFKDENGVLRVKTRLGLTEEEWNFRYPILLPTNHNLVERLVEELHRENKHAGVATMLARLREDYWIIKGRRSVKAIINRCMKCKRQTSRPLVAPEAPLPMDRIYASHVFQVTGIDLAGPMFTRDKKKCWIVLFTCAVFRAVHLELVSALSTEAFLMAFRRFVARRGRVETVYTDNGTNFVGASNALKKIDWSKIVDRTACQKINWKFIPPTAAWWGGWWERLVRTVKELLRRNLGRSVVDLEELGTLLCDCEAIVNSRPLTYVAEGDKVVPLTPSLFLNNITTETADLDHVDRNQMRRRNKVMQNLRDTLRERFRKEYLGLLITRKDKREMGEIKVGNVVLVEAPQEKRMYWPIAVVTEVIRGRDGHPRVARLRLPQGEERLRPVQRLCPLEISTNEGEELQSSQVLGVGGCWK